MSWKMNALTKILVKKKKNGCRIKIDKENRDYELIARPMESTKLKNFAVNREEKDLHLDSYHLFSLWLI